MITLMTTSLIELALIASLSCFASSSPPAPGFESCVPNDVDLNSVVLNEVQSTTSKPAAKEITVRQRLTQLKARCKKGKLVDGKGKPIYLYTLVGCWGNPPQDYLEILKNQEEEIQRLKKKYTVIQISCAQGDPRLISQNVP